MEMKAPHLPYLGDKNAINPTKFRANVFDISQPFNI